MQIVQCVSLTTACIAYLWPFLQSLRTGKLWAEDVVQSTFNRSTVASKTRSGNNNRHNRQGEEYIEIESQITTSSERIQASEIETTRSQAWPNFDSYQAKVGTT